MEKSIKGGIEGGGGTGKYFREREKGGLRYGR